MKYNTSIMIAVIVFVVIIFTTTCGCTRFVPYNSAGAFTKEFPYEGFDTLHNPTEYSTRNVHAALDTYNSFLISPDADACKKIYGFDGLYCKPYEADKKIDPFSDTKGSASCIGSSSGLTNSQGGLCLNDQQKQLLSTRGGNAAVPDSQIGH
jgi:hypothetical protein